MSRRMGHMSFEEALAAASRDEGFKATVYAMNTLLIHKGIYTQEEFQVLFAEWVEEGTPEKGKYESAKRRQPRFRVVLRDGCWQSGGFAQCIPMSRTGKSARVSLP